MGSRTTFGLLGDLALMKKRALPKGTEVGKMDGVKAKLWASPVSGGQSARPKERIVSHTVLSYYLMFLSWSRGTRIGREEDSRLDEAPAGRKGRVRPAVCTVGRVHIASGAARRTTVEGTNEGILCDGRVLRKVARKGFENEERRVCEEVDGNEREGTEGADVYMKPA
jgi:hypothetical protein